MIALALALATLAPPLTAPDAPKLRGCCAFGRDLSMRIGPLETPLRLDNALGVEGLGQHRAGAGLGEGNGALYTCAGGFIDVAHVRTAADAVGGLYAALAQPGHAPLRRPVLEGVALIERDAPLSDPLGAATRAVALMSAWHEVATAHGARYIAAHDERFSALSPEDLYSDLLGVYVAEAALALQAEAPTLSWDMAVTRALDARLRRLGALDKATTRRAFDLAAGRLWDPRRAIPDHRLVLARRGLDRGRWVWPARVALAECAGRYAEPLLFPRAEGVRLRFEVAAPLRAALGGDTLSEAALLRLARAAPPPFAAPPPSPDPQQVDLLEVGLEGAAWPKPLGGLRLTAADLDTRGGRLRVAHGGVWLREGVILSGITALESPGLYGCVARDGEAHAPLLALFADCRPARLGLTGRLGRVVMDHRAGVIAGEPVALGAAVALLSPAFTDRRHHLDLAVEGGLETISEGADPRRHPAAWSAPLRGRLLGQLSPWAGLRIEGEAATSWRRSAGWSGRLALGLAWRGAAWGLALRAHHLHQPSRAARLLDAPAQGAAVGLTLSLRPPRLTL
ncbi:DUF4056 domain-containing protein [Myxococcota bacterium]|nr:DUF4056 domain-containing protein [Myxococcota bacterium]